MAMTKRYTTVNGQIMFAEQVSEPGKSIALVPDTLGNVIANKDVNGDMVRTCEYWPYGEIRTETDSNPTPFGYGGTWGYYSDPSGLLYVRARYYKPFEGRWLTVDPLWPGESAYGYCRNVPLMQIDFSGEGVGPCAVYACEPKEGGKAGFIHQFICVDGPYGGCSGGTSSRLFNDSCKVDLDKGGPGKPPCLQVLPSSLYNCSLVTNSCEGAGEACKQIKNWPNSELCYWVAGTCYGFSEYVQRKARCAACEEIKAKNSPAYIECVCKSCFCTTGLLLGRRCKSHTGKSFKCPRNTWGTFR